MTDTLPLAGSILLAIQHGPLVTVRIDGCEGEIVMGVDKWLALRAMGDVLGAADKRHAEDRAEIDTALRERDEYHEMLRTILSLCDDSTRASIGRDAPLRAVRALAAERDVLRQECRELTAQRDAACSALALRERMEGGHG